MGNQSRTLTWLHIGDFHVNDGDPYDRDTVLRALIESVQHQREHNGRKPDLILVTGDIAHSGAASQYDRATTFLKDLERAAGITRDRVFVIPGNHDVDRAKGQRLARTLGSVHESHEFFGSADDVNLYLRKQAAFRAWHDDFFNGVRTLADATTCEPPVTVEVNGLRVAIGQINTSLFCQGDDDHNKLWVGRRCLEPVTAAVRQGGADIRIALMHHPLDWLHDEERSNITALLRDSFDVILRGHLHETDAEAVAGVTGSAIQLACGAAYQGSRWPSRVMYVTADYEPGQLTIFPIRYEDRPRPIWTTDPSVFPMKPTHEGSLLVTWKAIATSTRIESGQVANHSRNNLPHPLTSFIGRTKQINEVTTLLRTKRLVTLTGVGGGGKSRLALRLANDLVNEFHDGIALVELAPISDKSLVSQAVMTALNPKERIGRSADETIVRFLADRRFLLILDNCEHLLDACAHLADKVLKSCAQVVILATTRQRLGIIGEATYPVPPLSTSDPRRKLPSLARLRNVEAVTLFMERAQLSSRAFDLTDENAQAIVDVCHRLDGIPLAIELTAAQLRTIPIDRIQEELKARIDLPAARNRAALPHQQTLRATIDWSYEKLSEPEQQLFCRLSVFSGGWELDAATDVCCFTPIKREDSFDLLTNLVEKSLVEVTGEYRFRMLETLRHYANEYLISKDQKEVVQQRHQDWFLMMAEKNALRLHTPELKILHDLEVEHDNLRIALNYCEQKILRDVDNVKSAENGLRFVAALWQFWKLRGYLTEGRDHTLRMLDLDRLQSQTLPRAKALEGAGRLALSQGDYNTGQIYLTAALDIFRQLGDKRGTASSLLALGDILRNRCEYDTATAHYDDALTIFRELNDERGEAWTLSSLANVTLEQGDYAITLERFNDSLAIFQRLHDRNSEAWSLCGIGRVAVDKGEYESARSHFEAALTIFILLEDKSGQAMTIHDLATVARYQGDLKNSTNLLRRAIDLYKVIGDRQGEASTIHSYGNILADQGRHNDARIEFARALQLFVDLGDKQEEVIARYNLANIELEEERYEDARREYIHALSIARKLSDKRLIAFILQGLAAALLGLGNAVKTARLQGAADRLHEMIETQLSPKGKADNDEQITKCRHALEVGEYDAAWKIGRTLSWEQAAAYALGEYSIDEALE